MYKFPEILAGPMLRRVTENRVCVFVASSVAIDYTLQVNDRNKKPIGSSDKGKLTSHKLGNKLWVTLFEAWPEDSDKFPSDDLLYYQLWNNHTDAAVDLAEVCLTGHDSPCFFITTKLSSLAHGSCRKPHGLSFDDNGNEINIDALSLLSDQLDSNSTDLHARPALLMLTGDQIYADDVATSLAEVLKKKAVDLIGYDYGAPGIEKPSQLASDSRMNKLQQLGTGFSSDKASNHLISFSEYAAMYLFVFGNCANWKLDNKDKADNPQLVAFCKSLPKVRKVLANIPSYMVFDDHEVSDDWNITREWYDQVRYSPAGRRIVSNALAAYWAFQGWGNHPESYGNEFVRTVVRHLADPEDSDYAERFDLQMWKHRGWGFSVPTSPPLIILDTRTQRDFDSTDSPAQLMDRYALDWLRMTWAELKTRQLSGSPVIISATPVLGFDPVQKLQWFLRKLNVKASKLDIESWIANKKGFSYFMDTLLLRMNINEVVFLSGDVHYSFVNSGHYQADGKKINILQLTSSALKNSAKHGRFLDWLAGLLEHTETHKGLRSTKLLPWYLRWLVWLVSDDKKYPVWKLTIKGVPAKKSERLISACPNIALVFFENGKVKKQQLVTGSKTTEIIDFEF
ncbi:MAG: alkaline phosphatase D family protein [Gammaproteobacteria bacterium]|nr:alkaline phosphatase D family protein [Gammaproteobacteria bacterium]